MHYHFQAQNKCRKQSEGCFEMSYNKTLFFWGGGMKNKNEIKDENEASYFYVQGACNSTPRCLLRCMDTIACHSSPSLCREIKLAKCIVEDKRK